MLSKLYRNSSLEYSMPLSGKGVGSPVYYYQNQTLQQLVEGIQPSPSQKVIYVNRTFDLFTPGHIELLQLIYASHPLSYIVIGLHNDYAINKNKKDPYPDAKEMGTFKTVGNHKWDDISARKIVNRILDRRMEFKERQRKKASKLALEEELNTMHK
jgi:hypothetical protein